MALRMPPPKPPRVGTMDEGALYRVHFRLWQIGLSAVTVVVTGWFWTLGPAAGLTAAFLAKHVLVAILAAGLHLPEAQTRQ